MAAPVYHLGFQNCSRQTNDFTIDFAGFQVSCDLTTNGPPAGISLSQIGRLQLQGISGGSWLSESQLHFTVATAVLSGRSF